jgi:hypothetical protein
MTNRARSSLGARSALACLALGLGWSAGAAADAPAGQRLIEALHRAAPSLDLEILRLALTAQREALREGLVERPDILSVIDYSLPSTTPRFWVFDLERAKLLYRELIAHGRGTGENWARAFSNRHGSKQSSLGLFATAGTYYGRNGYSLYLHGLEAEVNDNAYDRTIVMHGAWYVSKEFARKHGRLGRSWGCPALRQAVSREVIDRIKNGSALFIYYPDRRWLARSGFLSTAPAGPSGRTAELGAFRRR